MDPTRRADIQRRMEAAAKQAVFNGVRDEAAKAPAKKEESEARLAKARAAYAAWLEEVKLAQQQAAAAAAQQKQAGAGAGDGGKKSGV